MKQIVKGKRYNTETAERVAGDSFSNYGDFHYWCEEIYHTKKGNWFLYGEGGAMSKYAQAIGQNEVGGGSAIIPLTKSDALAWLEGHTSSSDIFEKYFSDVIEEA